MRFKLFLLYVQTGLIVSDVNSGHHKAVRGLAVLEDPNVQTMIEQGIDESVFKKSVDYVNWVYGLTPRPHWFVLSNEGPVDPNDPNGEHFKTPEEFDKIIVK